MRGRGKGRGWDGRGVGKARRKVGDGQSHNGTAWLRRDTRQGGVRWRRGQRHAASDRGNWLVEVVAR